MFTAPHEIVAAAPPVCGVAHKLYKKLNKIFKTNYVSYAVGGFTDSTIVYPMQWVGTNDQTVLYPWSG